MSQTITGAERFKLLEEANLLLRVVDSNAAEETRHLADGLLYVTLIDLFEVSCECDDEGADDTDDTDDPIISDLGPLFKHN